MEVRLGAGLAALIFCASGCHYSSDVASRSTSLPSRVTSTSVAGSQTASASTESPAPTATSPLTAPTSPPAAGSCHARGIGLYELPDRACTPGATNPDVTEADINETICSSGWTATVRPAENYTEPLKYQQIAAYGDTGPVSGYEEDHLVPLELGGSPTSPQNLWPEPGASPNPKDSVEDAANHAVCAGRMTLTAAQQAIAANWIALGQQLGVVQTPTTQTSTGKTGTCTANASYDTSYTDWDIYVHSNQLNQPVEVTASGQNTATWHTDSTGYADVYLHAPENEAGQPVTVTVGSATCSINL